MGRGVAKKGDQISVDAMGCPPVKIANAVVDSVKINGKPCAVMGSMGSNHQNPAVPIPPHPPVIIATAVTVLAGGRPVARKGDPTACGAFVTSASGNVNAGP